MFAPRGGDGGDYPLTPTRVYTNPLISNMHLLCRTHHRLKTAGTWDVALHADGTEVWTSHGDGHQVVTMPDGPLARENFAERGVRKARVVRQLNAEIMQRNEGEPPY
ncbi:hypothetical protein ACN4D7_00325 [Corynebacterium macclintockiae]